MHILQELLRDSKSPITESALEIDAVLNLVGMNLHMAGLIDISMYYLGEEPGNIGLLEVFHLPKVLRQSILERQT